MAGRYETRLRAREFYEDASWEFVFLLPEERDAVAGAIEALRELLDYIERAHGGDPTLTSESYYIERDFARIALATLDGL